jgi:small subunit ribosomal protein S8
MVTDSIADMLTRIRNAIMARHDEVAIPLSKPLLAIAKILKDEGFINDFSIVNDNKHRFLKIKLKYIDSQSAIVGLERVSKPGLRIYVKRGEIPRVYGGLGIAIISTSKGIIVGKDAWNRKLGGELLCYVW